MKITRDIVLDLLPLYLANEASADSRQLIEEYLLTDKDFAQWLTEQRSTSLPNDVISPSQQLEKDAFMNFKHFQRKKSFLMALAIFFSAMPFTFMFDGSKGLIWWMIKDNPAQAFSFIFLAVCTWIGYFWMNRDQSPQ